KSLDADRCETIWRKLSTGHLCHRDTDKHSRSDDDRGHEDGPKQPHDGLLVFYFDIAPCQNQQQIPKNVRCAADLATTRSIAGTISRDGGLLNLGIDHFGFLFHHEITVCHAVRWQGDT